MLCMHVLAADRAAFAADRAAFAADRAADRQLPGVRSRAGRC